MKSMKAWAPALFRGATGERLDPAGSLGAAGLLSGDLVTLGDPPEPAPPPPPAGTDGVSLDVVAGPEAGRSVVLSPRRYLLGRSGECDITIGDPTVSRRQLAIEVRQGAPPLITSQPDATQTLLLDGVPNAQPFELGDDSVQPELIDLEAAQFAVDPLSPPGRGQQG